jgi:hypothetical protein
MGLAALVAMAHCFIPVQCSNKITFPYGIAILLRSCSGTHI